MGYFEKKITRFDARLFLSAAMFFSCGLCTTL